MTQINSLNIPLLQRCADMALGGIHREFPCQLPLMLDEPTEFRRPRELTPAFYGCYDWHSAVHSHWLLIRWLSLELHEPTRNSLVRDALSTSFTAGNLAAEYRFLNYPARTGFERPYGLAWLLQLTSELRTWSDPIASTWLNHFRPLEELAVSRFRDWLPKLPAPIRTGEHSQTAFALGLVADWADYAADKVTAKLVGENALRFHAADRNLPLHLEPSGHDFLSPSLATADLMRRFLEPPAFSDWLSAALPGFPIETRLAPVTLPADVQDGKLAHYAGLNFSRAWMLLGLASGLPSDDIRRPALRQLAQAHVEAGTPMLECNEYSVTHWVGSFAMYALTAQT